MGLTDDQLIDKMFGTIRDIRKSLLLRSQQRRIDILANILSIFDEPEIEPERCVLTTSDINRLEQVLVKTNNEYKDECSICLDNFYINEKVLFLKCHHYFHHSCVEKWLLHESNKCPKCRTVQRIC